MLITPSCLPQEMRHHATPRLAPRPPAYRRQPSRVGCDLHLGQHGQCPVGDVTGWSIGGHGRGASRISLLLLVLTGCADDSARIPGSVMVDTLDGVMRVTNTGPGLWTDASAWGVQE